MVLVEVAPKCNRFVVGLVVFVRDSENINYLFIFHLFKFQFYFV